MKARLLRWRVEAEISGGRWDDHKLAVVWLTRFFCCFFLCFFFFVELHHSSNVNFIYLNNDSYGMTASSPLLPLCCYN